MSPIQDKLIQILRDRPTVVTRAFFWKIPHKSRGASVALKVGRYRKPKDWREQVYPETLEPKSELTFDEEEFQALIKFLQENYEPFRQGFKAFIPVDKPFTTANAEQVRKLFALPEHDRLLEFLTQEAIVPEHILAGLENTRRVHAVRDFEHMLEKDLVEGAWQDWFQENPWVLGSEFVRVLDERRIDTRHISDFLMEAYDGFVDVVEIKRPEGGMRFWAQALDHGNHVPSSDLTKAISQAAKYLFEVEREANSVKFRESVGGVPTVKPRGVLVFGRSADWDAAQCESYRILNSSYHNLTIMTYDHVLERARRIAGIGS